MVKHLLEIHKFMYEQYLTHFGAICDKFVNMIFMVGNFTNTVVIGYKNIVGSREKCSYNRYSVIVLYISLITFYIHISVIRTL